MRYSAVDLDFGIELQNVIYLNPQAKLYDLARQGISKDVYLVHGILLDGLYLTLEAYEESKRYMTLEDLATHKATPIDAGVAAFMAERVYVAAEIAQLVDFIRTGHLST